MGCGGGGGGSSSSSSSGTSGSSSGSAVTPSSVIGDEAGTVTDGVVNIGRPTFMEDFSFDSKFSKLTPHLSYAANNNMLEIQYDAGMFARKVKILNIDGDTRLDLSQSFKFQTFGISFEPELKYSNIQAKNISQNFEVDLFQIKMMAGKSFAYNGSLIRLQSGVFRDTSALFKERYGALLKGSTQSHGQNFAASYGMISLPNKTYHDIKFEFSINF